MAHHGNTPAAWTGVTIMLIGWLVGAIGLVLDGAGLLFWIGVALQPIALVVGAVMSKMGMGAEPVNH